MKKSRFTDSQIMDALNRTKVGINLKSATGHGPVALLQTVVKNGGLPCFGRTPMRTLIDGTEAWHHKIATLNNQFYLTAISIK